MAKVAHILYGGLGGQVDLVRDLVTHNLMREHEHMIVFYGIEQPSSQTMKAYEVDNVVLHTIHYRPGQWIYSIKQLFKLLKRYLPSTIILHNNELIPFMGLWSWLNKCNCIVVEHQSLTLKGLKGWMASTMSLILAKRVVYLTTAYREGVLKRIRLFFNERKVVIINNGVNLNQFLPVHRPLSHSLILGMVSRINNIKDHETLIRAFGKANISKSILKLAGDGDEVLRLKRLVRQLKLGERVKFVGVISGTDLIDFYQSLDVYTHATFGETMSVSIAQAQACGLPVIASKVNGVIEVIKHEVNGLLVENESGWIENIKLLAGSTELRVKLGNNSHAYASKHLSHDAMVLKYNNLIE